METIPSNTHQHTRCTTGALFIDAAAVSPAH